MTTVTDLLLAILCGLLPVAGYVVGAIWLLERR